MEIQTDIRDILSSKQKAEAKAGTQPQYDNSKLVELQKNAQREVEFNRYKQDCRKRALELAYNRSTRFGEEIKEAIGSQQIIKDIEDEPHTTESIKEDVLMWLADKYYQWLISIPNE